MSLRALLKLAGDDDEPKQDDWYSTKGKGKGKGGKGKGGKGKGASLFTNTDGSTQQRCWDFDEYGECWKYECGRAHVSYTTGVNSNPPKGDAAGGTGPGKGGGAPKGGAAPAHPTGAPAGTAARTDGRRVLGRREQAADPEKPSSEAMRVRESVSNAIIDPNGYETKKEGVEIAAMVSLTVANELSELDSDGDAVNDIMAVERATKPYLESIKGFLKTTAEKDGAKLGVKGVKAIHDTMIKFFADQKVTKKLTAVISEDPKVKPEEALDPAALALKGVGAMLAEALGNALGTGGDAGGKPRTGVITVSPVRKKRGIGSPKKAGKESKEAEMRRKRLEDLRRRLANDSDDEDEDEEEDDAGMSGAGGAPTTPTREDLLEATATILSTIMSGVETKLEALGRSSHDAKKDYNENQPLADMKAEWIGTAAASSTLKTLNVSAFDDCVAFMHDNYQKEDVEIGTDRLLPEMLELANGLKKPGEIMAKLMESHGVKFRGPRRFKMSAILCAFTVAKHFRVNKGPGSA